MYSDFRVVSDFRIKYSIRIILYFIRHIRFLILCSWSNGRIDSNLRFHPNHPALHPTHPISAFCIRICRIVGWTRRQIRIRIILYFIRHIRLLHFVFGFVGLLDGLGFKVPSESSCTPSDSSDFCILYVFGFVGFSDRLGFKVPSESSCTPSDSSDFCILYSDLSDCRMDSDLKFHPNHPALHPTHPISAFCIRICRMVGWTRRQIRIRIILYFIRHIRFLHFVFGFVGWSDGLGFAEWVNFLIACVLSESKIRVRRDVDRVYAEPTWYTST